MSPPVVLLIASVLVVILSPVFGSEYDHKYQPEDAIHLWVNKVGPYNNPQETYNYYSLPFCRRFGHAGHKWGGLGEVLGGNELTDSQFDIKFQKNVEKTTICKLQFDEAKVKEFKEAIENNYWFEFFMVMSGDDNKSVVMKGIAHGACDYLIKPLRLEAIRNIWQHVVRKRNPVQRDLKRSTTLGNSDRQYSSSPNEEHVKSKKRKIDKEDEYEERDESSSSQGSRVVWSQDLHQQFVAAVNQIGYEKAVPTKILELMNNPGLTRANVASHLQKFRMYLNKLFRSHPSTISTSLKLNTEASFSDCGLQALAASGQLNRLPAQSLATLHTMARGGLGNKKSPIAAPLNDQKLAYTQVQNSRCHDSNIVKPTNSFHGIPTNMDPSQLEGLQQSFTGMNSQNQTYNHTSRPSNFQTGPTNNTRATSTSVYNLAVLLNSSLVNFSPNHRRESPGNTFLVRSSSGSFSKMSTSTLRPEVCVPIYSLSNYINQNRLHYIGLQDVNMTVLPTQHTNNMHVGLNGLTHNYNARPRVGVNKVVCPQPYSLVNLPNTILTQPRQQGIRELAPNTWYSLDNF